MGPGGSQVRPGLLLGGRRDAMDRTLLEEQRVTHIINVSKSSYEVPLVGVRTMKIAIDDDEFEDIFLHLDPAMDFIQQALGANGVVLIHCEYGISRSPTVAAAYLMKAENLGAIDALKSVHDSRGIVFPNRIFLGALVEWDRKLRGESYADLLQELQKVVQFT